MHRRDFLAATAVAGAAPLARSLAPLETLGAAAERQFIEIRRYQLLPGARQRAFVDFIGGAAIPAMNRAGVSKVGAFTVMFGENAPSLLLVLVHPSLDSVVSLRERMAADAAYVQAGAGVADAPMSEPAFVREESTLLRAFTAMPAVEPAAGAGTGAGRVYEMRTYQSHSDRAALNKLQMFNAGEVPIFRRAGLTPVFFGETVIGAGMPSLTYMLVFPDMRARDAAWAVFGQDPEWKALSGDPQYKDNVSAITDVILKPTAYSQL